MIRLYVAGPIPDDRLRPDRRSQSKELYGNVQSWCASRHVGTHIPTDDLDWREMSVWEFHKRVRSMITDSTHMLVIPVVNSIATGIEAEYARELGRPIGVWYPDGSVGSRLLSAMASIEAEDDEPLEKFLRRFIQ